MQQAGSRWDEERTYGAGYESPGWRRAQARGYAGGPHGRTQVIEGEGRLVAVSSLAGMTGVPTRTGYAASKHAVTGFAECLMLEVREHGVKVSTVNPGAVATDFSPRADANWMLSPDAVAESIAHVLAMPPDVLVHSLEIRALAPPKKH